MLEELFLAAGEAGLRVRLDRARRELGLSLTAGAGPEKAKTAIYPLLGALENNFLITVGGAPACLAPDAFEHFTWPLGARGPFRRIRACASCALKGRCPGVNGAWKDSSALRPVLPAPAELVIELNKRCNLACRACFGRTGEELPFRAAEKALREASALGVRSARFTGGEPLLHAGLGKLLRLAKKLGFYTLLNTNGVLITRARALALKGLVDNVLISLPGVDGVSHAFGSGRPGTLGAKAAAVKALRSAGVGMVRAGSVISAPLIKDFSRWHKAVSRLGFDIWELYRPMMTRQALAAAPEFGISKTGFSRLARKVSAQRPGLARAVLANPVPFCALPAAARPFALGARFDDGWTRLVLDASGNYKPSYPSRRFLGGQLAAAWSNRFLKRTRCGAWLPQACRSCRMLSTCLAGSRFQAQMAGSAFGPDPWMKR